MKRQVVVISVIGAVLGLSTLAEADSRRGGSGSGRDRCSTEDTVDERCMTAIALATGAAEAAAATSSDPVVTADQAGPLGPTAPADDPTAGLPAPDTTATTEPTTIVVPVSQPPTTEPTTIVVPVTQPTVTAAPSVTAAPPATDPPPVTDPPVTTPSSTDPPPVTAAPVTTPSSTDPPPSTDPPVPTPSSTNPPPVTDPPVTAPPATDPPVTIPPVKPSFTMSTTTPGVGEPVTFDASASECPPGVACSYTWEWFWRDGTTTRVGGQMGRTPTITYVFDAFAASKQSVTVLLTIAQGRVGPVQRVQTTFTVSA